MRFSRLLFFFAVLFYLLSVSLFASPTETKQSNGDLAQYFTAVERDGVIVGTTVLHELQSESDDTWAAVLISGLALASEQAGFGDTLAVFIDINGTTIAYAVDYDSYYDLNNNAITVDEFVNQIQQMPIK